MSLLAWTLAAQIVVQPAEWRRLPGHTGLDAIVRFRYLGMEPDLSFDGRPWPAGTNVTTPAYGVPGGLGAPPAIFDGLRVSRSTSSDGREVAVVRSDRNLSELVVVDDRTVDLSAWSERGMEVRWAEVRGETLYVSHAHRSFSDSTDGINGFLSAVDLTTGDLVWRTQPQTVNSENFAIGGDLIYTGYGFTSEPDYVMAIDRATGELVGRARVRSAPDWLAYQGGALHVRTYDRRYVFRPEVTPN